MDNQPTQEVRPKFLEVRPEVSEVRPTIPEACPEKPEVRPEAGHFYSILTMSYRPLKTV